jgi:triosephosphate isomerase
MSRKSFVGGNWKSFNNASKVSELVSGLKDLSFAKSVDVLVAPTFIYVDRVKQALGDSFLVSAQNSSLTDDGAFTGEISASGLASFGLNWVILGHSERRALFGESNATVGKKVEVALKAGLSVVACVGETLEDRKAERTDAVVADQLAAIKAGIEAAGANAWERVVIAYEPVWAIGTGVVATPQQAQDTQKAIRAWLTQNVRLLPLLSKLPC